MATFNLAAGHGAADPGATNGARLEKNDNLRLSLAVGSELIKRGHSVRQFRKDDSVNCSWQACRTWLESNAANCGIVFHRNAFSSASANGVEVWNFNDNTKATDLAVKMSASISAASGMSNRGRKGNGAAWLSPNVFCVEPEIGFISNTDDNNKFDQNFNAIVKAVCDSLENVFGSAAPLPSNIIGTATVKTLLNIRSGPATSYPSLGTMPAGTVVPVYELGTGWAKISYNGITGWSSTEWLTVAINENPDESCSQELQASKTKIIELEAKVSDYESRISKIREALK